MFLAGPDTADPSLSPLAWPQLAAAPVAGILAGALPGWLAPPAPGSAPA
jgi:energy-coupling factor transport system permease protein